MTGILKGFPALRQRNLGNFLSKGINGWNSDLKKICETDSSSPSSCRLQSFTTSASTQWNSLAKTLNKLRRMLDFPYSVSRKL
jgi:hypothetical protein